MRLSIEGVTKRFGDKYAVNDFSVELSEGVYGLLGPNGAGKTTLMRMITDILDPSRGRVCLDGVDIKELGPAYRNKLGYLPQNLGVYRNFSAKHFMMYIAALKGITGKKAEKRCDQLFEIVGLKDYKKQRLGTFSGGMKRRIGIAQALLNDPKILILDEPTAGLDPQERIRFRNLISEISGNRIVILSTHIVTDIEYIAREVMLMKSGVLVEMGRTGDLIDKVRGKVWAAIVPHTRIDHMKAQFNVGNIVHKPEGLELRIVSPERPTEDSQSVEPVLEDVYLYYFGEVGKNDGIYS